MLLYCLDEYWMFRFALRKPSVITCFHAHGRRQTANVINIFLFTMLALVMLLWAGCQQKTSY